MLIAISHPTSSIFSAIHWMGIKRADLGKDEPQGLDHVVHEMQLNRGRIREVEAPLGVTLECTAGRIWITLDHDPRDVILDPGQAFVVDRDQRTLVMALEKASVRISRPELA
ncbi:DUF2917 domain-containing protein [Rhodoferax aquaticus]|uniref:DUF2917 domain-containing protein n=1 Tax=Rhodoferax aquaticus TaxID=2527691 RepID=A0A515ER99_9BURK|nr:DUF2917 domain-containing protein [Rhodoferax aquaticus]QDL55158.1 DUF2917 domain-containing protein [Rhodoferax aquaticus]